MKKGKIIAGAGRMVIFIMTTILVYPNLLFAGEEEKTNPGNEKSAHDTLNAGVAVVDTVVTTDENVTASLMSDLDMNDEDALLDMVDSLLDLESIPMDVIEKIMFYSEKHLMEKEEKFLFGGTSKYLGNNYYNGVWDETNTHPYNESLSANDSSLMLILEDPEYNCGFELPLKGVITSKFGYREGRMHKGIDVDLEVWDPVKSAFPGVVRVAKWYGGYGRVVVVRHYNGLETLYAHLHRIKVKPGQMVEAGDVVGLGGSSGNSTGSHLHFEVRFKGLPVDPLNFISYEEEKLKNDSLVLKKQEWNYAAIPVGTVMHKVERGESLYSIAKKYGTTTYELSRINGIPRRKYLYVGQMLRIADPM